MANKKQLELLKQGYLVWNNWRIKYSADNIDLKKADLSKAKLNSFDLYNADLSGADLRRADLGEADLTFANLSHANLNGARLNFTKIAYANLSGADLSSADLSDAIFNSVNLNNTNFNNSFMVATIFAFNDLSTSMGLETVTHEGPSTIDTHTIQMSKGKIPTGFLRGCGLSDLEIEFTKLSSPNLSTEEITDITNKINYLRVGNNSIKYPSVFISYSSKDKNFPKSCIKIFKTTEYAAGLPRKI